MPAHYDFDEGEKVSSKHEYFGELIENFCNGGNIKHCLFGNYTIDEVFIRDNLELIKHVQSLFLDMRQKDMNNCASLISKLYNAKKLKIETENIREMPGVNKFLRAININKLEALQLFGFNEKINCENLPCNMKLKHLEVPNCSCDPKLLVQHFPNLEFLEFGDEKMNYGLETLLGLSRLKHISLIYGKKHYANILLLVNKLVDHNAALETFKLNDNYNRTKDYANTIEKDQYKNELCLATALQRLVNLTTLGLTTVFTMKNHLEGIAIKLKGLRHFEFGCTGGGCGFSKEKELIPKILKFVKLSEKLVKLTLKFHLENIELDEFYSALVDIRQKQNSREILNVAILSYECHHTQSSNYGFKNQLKKNEKVYVKISHTYIEDFECEYEEECCANCYNMM